MHNANLANLYVASYQLHGTLRRDAVLGAIQEIIVNLAMHSSSDAIRHAHSRAGEVVMRIG